MRGVPKHICRGCGKQRQKGDKFSEGGLSYAEELTMTDAEIATFNPMICDACLTVESAKLWAMLTKGIEP